MPTKAELLAEAEKAGVDVPEKATKKDLEAALSGEEVEAPPAVAALAKLDAPTDPLPGTPVDAGTEYEALGEAKPDLEAPTDKAGVDPVAKRGPLEVTPHDSELGEHAGRVEDGVRIKDGA